MKIYANRQSKSDSEILNSLVGTDTWVNVTDLDTKQELYIRLVALGTDAETNREPWYSYNAVGAAFVDKYHKCLSNEFVARMLKTVYRGPVASFSVHRPMELLSTAELVSITKQDLPDQDGYILDSLGTTVRGD